MSSEPRVFTDVAAFAKLHIDTGDIDPAYPVLRYVIDAGELSEEEALWLTVLYVAHYDLGSALTSFRFASEPLSELNPISKALPCGTERRGLRGGAVVPYVADYAAHIRADGGRQGPWMRMGFQRDPVENYLAFWETWQTVKWNGRWSAFKMAEILRKVHDFPLKAPDMRLEFCSGPKEGLCWLYDVPDSTPVPQLNELAVDLRARLEDVLGCTVDWEELETILCDFNSLRRGRYYVGHDIDLMLEQLDRAPVGLYWQLVLSNARKASFPKSYLGEYSGWRGVDKERKRLYKGTGLVAVR